MSSAFYGIKWSAGIGIAPLESTQPLPLMKTLKFLGVMWFAQGHNKLAAKMEPERKSPVLFFHGAQ